MSRRIYQRLELGHYKVPHEILTLERDICTLTYIIRMLETLQPENVTDGREEGVSLLRALQSMAILCKRYAELRRRSFLKKN